MLTDLPPPWSVRLATVGVHRNIATSRAGGTIPRALNARAIPTPLFELYIFYQRDCVFKRKLNVYPVSLKVDDCKQKTRTDCKLINAWSTTKTNWHSSRRNNPDDISSLNRNSNLAELFRWPTTTTHRQQSTRTNPNYRARMRSFVCAYQSIDKNIICITFYIHQLTQHPTIASWLYTYDVSIIIITFY